MEKRAKEGMKILMERFIRIKTIFIVLLEDKMDGGGGAGGGCSG